MPYSILIRTSFISQSGFQSSSQPAAALSTIVERFDTESEAVNAAAKITSSGTSAVDPRVRTEAIPLFTRAPVLTSATATPTGSGTASGTVTTTVNDGTLYRLISVNATETVDTVIATGLAQAVTQNGSPNVQNVTFTGLVQGTTYYAHYAQVSGFNNGTRKSLSVARSASFVAT